MSAEEPTDRHRPKLQALEAAILNGHGVLPPEARQDATRGDRTPEPFADYVDTIHRHAFRITDRMVAGLTEPARARTRCSRSAWPPPGAARRRSRPGSARCARLGRLMRLQAVARGRGIGAKAKFAMIRLVSGAPTLDVVKTLSFRPAFFGTPFNAEPGGHARSVGVDGRRAGYSPRSSRTEPVRVLNGCPRRGRVEELRGGGDDRRP